MTVRPTLTGTRIRERRLALGRRQSDVAKAAGISAAYLNLIEHNRRRVGAPLVERLAEALALAPAELAAGREEARLAALREAAARRRPAAGPDADPAGPATAELDQAPEFLARFPGWADTLIATAQQADALEGRLVALADRMRQDPHWLTMMHAVLSAATGLRASAAILAEGPLPEDWAARFRANLDADSQRLSAAAQALVGYLDAVEAEGAPATPLGEVEAWMAEGSPPLAEAGSLASDAARALAQGHLDRMAAETAALPDAVLAGAAAALAPGTAPGAAVLALAARLGAPADLVMRRLAALRPAGFAAAGLVVCDGAGAILMRRPCPAFPQPRLGESCALWPLFGALAQPATVLAHRVETPEGARFDTVSHAVPRQPLGPEGPVLSLAQMLIVPASDDGRGGAGAIPIGPACRMCPRPACPARREPSILGPGG